MQQMNRVALEAFLCSVGCLMLLGHFCHLKTRTLKLYDVSLIIFRIVRTKKTAMETETET